MSADTRQIALLSGRTQDGPVPPSVKRAGRTIRSGATSERRRSRWMLDYDLVVWVVGHVP
jgi:hypothetical protein